MAFVQPWERENEQTFVYIPSAIPDQYRVRLYRRVGEEAPKSPEEREFSRKVKRGQGFKFDDPEEPRLTDFKFGPPPEVLTRDYDLWPENQEKRQKLLNDPKSQVGDLNEGMGLRLA